MKSKQNRANYIYENFLKDYLDEGSRVVDIGAGDCVLTKTIKDKKGLDIVAVDKENYSENDIIPIIYNGMRLPFDNNSFDCATIIFVLHYVKNREELLKETVRVSKKRVIIISDIYSNPMGSLWAKIWGYLANTSRSHDANASFAISGKEFDRVFSGLELIRIVAQKSFRMKPSWYLQKHKMVVLEK